jgi:ABC-type uncharacterized transport system fused permease/ATPase subunit
MARRRYNVLGTLGHQMTYPHLAEVPKETLLKILKEVDLEYLVERKGALDSEISWEETLSVRTA